MSDTIPELIKNEPTLTPSSSTTTTTTTTTAAAATTTTTTNENHNQISSVAAPGKDEPQLSAATARATTALAAAAAASKIDTSSAPVPEKQSNGVNPSATPAAAAAATPASVDDDGDAAAGANEHDLLESRVNERDVSLERQQIADASVMASRHFEELLASDELRDLLVTYVDEQQTTKPNAGEPFTPVFVADVFTAREEWTGPQLYGASDSAMVNIAGARIRAVAGQMAAKRHSAVIVFVDVADINVVMRAAGEIAITFHKGTPQTITERDPLRRLELLRLSAELTMMRASLDVMTNGVSGATSADDPPTPEELATHKRIVAELSRQLQERQRNAYYMLHQQALLILRHALTQDHSIIKSVKKHAKERQKSMLLLLVRSQNRRVYQPPQLLTREQVVSVRDEIARMSGGADNVPPSGQYFAVAVRIIDEQSPKHVGKTEISVMFEDHGTGPLFGASMRLTIDHIDIVQFQQNLGTFVTTPEQQAAAERAFHASGGGAGVAATNGAALKEKLDAARALETMKAPSPPKEEKATAAAKTTPTPPTLATTTTTEQKPKQQQKQQQKQKQNNKKK